jgi:histone-lysine N-methyltransferase SETMAR
MPLIENPSSVEVRAVIRFLNAKQKSPTENHKEVVEVYGENMISRKQVSVCCNHFKKSRTSLLEERAGRPTTARNAVNERRVEQLLLIETYARMKLKETAYTLNLSKTTVYRTVHDTLGYRKVSARWVPKELTEHHKAQRMGVSLNNLLRYQEDPAFLDNIVTGDETWVHHITPETKRNSMMWKQIISYRKEKSRHLSAK